MPVLATSIQGGLDPNPVAQANLADKYFFPTTSEVTGSYMEEAFQGVGSAVADYRAWQIKQEDATKFEPLNKELYESSPYYRPAVSFYEGMTNGAAKILAENSDEQEARNFIMSKASGAQTALGYLSAFGAGVLEPKNVVSGVVASAALSPVIGWVAPAGSSLRRVLALKRIAGNYGAKAGIGAAEGFVGAAITEPFNRSSAKTLQQDYTMADTMLNIGLSSAFGAGFNTVPSYIKEKWDLHGAKTPDIIAAEHDTAVTQLATGSKVDVEEVGRAALGDITTKPIAEQAKIAETFVKYTDTPEIKARLEGTAAADANGKPIMLYHGTGKDFEAISTIGEGKSLGAGAFLSSNPKIASTYAPTDGGNLRPSYLVIKKPLVVEMEGQNWSKIDGKTTVISNGISSRLDEHLNEFSVTSDKLSRWAKDNGYDGVIYKNASDRGPYYSEQGVTQLSDVYNVFSPEQIIPAFGERNLNDIIKEANATNKTASQKYYQDAISKNNDTAIDQKAISQLKDFEDNLLTDSEKAAIDDYKKYIAEIDTMEAEGISTAREEFMNAIDSMNEADIEEAYKNLHLCLTRG